jgi:hypothetical protein
MGGGLEGWELSSPAALYRRGRAMSSSCWASKKMAQAKDARWEEWRSPLAQARIWGREGGRKEGGRRMVGEYVCGAGT